ncbi:MAG: Epoxyqueuosine reductase [Syntrophaceae bacterium PtaB.Bin095]|nr:MAG: Epoxyqueuosine reductase [Syntrophaceae bacterium PtaB.Bin095]
MEKLTERIKELARCLGATAVGISTAETLAGGPPSVDLSYVLPGAKSAISFLVPLNQSHIEPYIQKKDHHSHEEDNIRTNTLVSGISFEIASYLMQKGHPSAGLTANITYRTDTPNGPFDEKPPVSHRYLAVRSGIGHFGLSGNVITRENGAASVLGSLVTTAALIPTEPLNPEDNYCDSCRLCIASCASGYMDPEKKTVVRMGDVDFTYSVRRHHSRCDYVCGGFTGLHTSGRWSTWSPARFPIPEKDEEFLPAIIAAADAYKNRPRQEGGFFHFLMPGNRIHFTCGNCMLVCHPDKKVRKRRYKMLTQSGVVVQRPDGKCEAVSPDEARKYLKKMPPGQRALYENV